jgi:hypothetical protein
MAVAANFVRQARIARSDGAVHVSKPGIGSVAAGPVGPAGAADPAGSGSTASADADAVAAGVAEGFVAEGFVVGFREGLGVAFTEGLGAAFSEERAESGCSPASSGDG